MRVVIPGSVLVQRRACRARFAADCPWWDAKQDALVYENWDQSVIDHYLKARVGGAGMLQWLVRHELVPMTMDEFNAATAEKRSFK